MCRAEDDEGDDEGGDLDDDMEGGRRRSKFGKGPKLKRAGSDVLPPGLSSPGRRGGGRGGGRGLGNGRGGRGAMPLRGGRGGGRGGRGGSARGRGGRGATAAALARSRSAGPGIVPTGRGFGRGGQARGLSEAAEALLGMGGLQGEGDSYGYDLEVSSRAWVNPRKGCSLSESGTVVSQGPVPEHTCS